MAQCEICCNKGREGHRRENDSLKGEDGRSQGKLCSEMILDVSFKNSEETAQAKAGKCETDESTPW